MGDALDDRHLPIWKRLVCERLYGTMASMKLHPLKPSEVRKQSPHLCKLIDPVCILPWTLLGPILSHVMSLDASIGPAWKHSQFLAAALDILPESHHRALLEGASATRSLSATFCKKAVAAFKGLPAGHIDNLHILSLPDKKARGDILDAMIEKPIIKHLILAEAKLAFQLLDVERVGSMPDLHGIRIEAPFKGIHDAAYHRLGEFMAKFPSLQVLDMALEVLDLGSINRQTFFNPARERLTGNIDRILVNTLTGLTLRLHHDERQQGPDFHFTGEPTHLSNLQRLQLSSSSCKSIESGIRHIRGPLTALILLADSERARCNEDDSSRAAGIVNTVVAMTGLRVLQIGEARPDPVWTHQAGLQVLEAMASGPPAAGVLFGLESLSLVLLQADLVQLMPSLAHFTQLHHMPEFEIDVLDIPRAVGPGAGVEPATRWQAFDNLELAMTAISVTNTPNNPFHLRALAGARRLKALHVLTAHVPTPADIDAVNQMERLTKVKIGGLDGKDDLDCTASSPSPSSDILAALSMLPNIREVELGSADLMEALQPCAAEGHPETWRALRIVILRIAIRSFGLQNWPLQSRRFLGCLRRICAARRLEEVVIGVAWVSADARDDTRNHDRFTELWYLAQQIVEEHAPKGCRLVLRARTPQVVAHLPELPDEAEEAAGEGQAAGGWNVPGDGNFLDGPTGAPDRAGRDARVEHRVSWAANELGGRDSGSGDSRSDATDDDEARNNAASAIDGLSGHDDGDFVSSEAGDHHEAGECEGCDAQEDNDGGPEEAQMRTGDGGPGEGLTAAEEEQYYDDVDWHGELSDEDGNSNVGPTTNEGEILPGSNY